ncbi:MULTISPECIES: hypothetical protein [Bacillus]|uniref:hypothetical protein n=1 Tax=Bacillus TaxID=1386 RepID=UPI00273E77F5|nr:hypothetical protein [Bacillus sp. MMSF_3328]
MQSKFVELDGNDFSQLIHAVRVKGIWFKSLEVEYRKKNGMILVRFRGAKSMILSEDYLMTIESQLKAIEKQYIRPLIEKCRTNFILNFTVNAQGRISPEADLSIKIDCPQKPTNTHDAFREPFGILMPFALYISNIEIRGHNFNVAVVEAHLKITADELLETLELPIIAPRTKEQWYPMAFTVYNEAKEEYRYEVSIPCVEGEMHWDHKMSTVQMTLFDNSRRTRRVAEGR